MSNPLTMRRNENLPVWLSVLVFGLFLFELPVCGAAPAPNILFLLTDDQRWDSLGCMGNKIVQTPQIDALARRGVLFRNAFVTTAICSVSRASIFSGQYERRHGIDDFAKPFSPSAWSNAYPAILRRNGYHTGFIGKFGVGNVMPTNGFDYWDGFPGQGRYFSKGDPQHLTAKMGESAIRFLHSRPDHKPFCLSISFKAPHVQDGAPREFPPDPRDEELYRDVRIPVSKTATAAAFEAQPDFVQNSEGRTRWKRRFATPEMFQETVKDYYRLITGVDREVGRILEALEQLRLSENTVVIFTSDHGFFLGEHGMAGKWLMHEESIRVPWIIADPTLPKRRRGRKLDAVALNIDLAPSILDYAGLETPEVMQGRSVKPLVEGKAVQWRDDWFYEHHFGHGGRIPQTEGIRTERWKYMRYVSADPVVEQLYDLKRDPGETKNLAGSSGHSEVLNRLRNRWGELREVLE